MNFEEIIDSARTEREAEHERQLSAARREAREARHAARMWRTLAWAAVVVALVVLFLALQDRAQAVEVEPKPVEARVVRYDPPPAPMPEIVPEARYALTDAERDIVERVVMAEAAGEGFDGQRLVAQCILNTAEAMDLRPDAVVLAPNQYASPAAEASQEVKDAVSAVFDAGDMATDEPIRWFYNDKLVYSEWHEGKRFVMYFGNHKFFAEW